MLNLAYGEILMFLGYILTTLVVSMHLHSAIGLVLMLIVSAILGLVLYRFINRPLLGEPFWVMIIVTLVLGLVFRGIAILVWGEPIALPAFIPTGG